MHDIQKGDIVILKLDCRYDSESVDMIKRITESLRKMVGEEINVIVLFEGQEFEIVKKPFDFNKMGIWKAE